MNNDRPPASKFRKWLMRNKESTLPGLAAEPSGACYSDTGQISGAASLAGPSPWWVCEGCGLVLMMQ